MAAQTYGSHFETKLRQRVEEERQRIMKELEGGEAVKTLDLYRERVGYLRALRELGGWCTEVATELNEG